MTVPQSETFDAAESLLYMMIERSTGGDADPDEFRQARAVVMADATASKLAPRCVRTCRDLGSVWTYVKARDDLDTYASRRQHFRKEFEPLLSALERFEVTPLESLVAEEAELLDSDAVMEAWRKALDRGHSDPAGAITAARSLLESVCKTILDDLPDPKDPHDKLDLTDLYARVADHLNLAPSKHSEDAIKRILGGTMNAVNGLAALRNDVGDSHGAGRRSYRPEPRHAALAVNFAGSMALFLMQTSEPLRSHAAAPSGS